MTGNEYRALCILRDKGPIRPREFAREFWPHSEGWDHHTKAGPYGSVKGGGMNLAGGGYLGKLRRKGWTEIERYPRSGYVHGHVLSTKGRAALAEYEAERNPSMEEYKYDPIAYELGCDARQKGFPLDLCIYSDKYLIESWTAGWNDMDQSLAPKEKDDV